MSQYQDYQQTITKQLLQYQKLKPESTNKKKIYKELNNSLDLYKMHLQQHSASYQKYQWLNQQVKKMHQIKNNLELKSGKQLTKQDIKDIQNDLNNRFGNMSKDLQEVIQVSNLIQIQLNDQIQKLDLVYEQNLQGKQRLERAKKGLIKIIKRAMLNKLTRCLAVFLLIAVIGLIVLYILKKYDIIKI